MDEQLPDRFEAHQDADAAEIREVLSWNKPHKPEVYGLISSTPRELMVMTYDGPEEWWILLQPPTNPMAPGETFPIEPGPWGKAIATMRYADQHDVEHEATVLESPSGERKVVFP